MHFACIYKHYWYGCFFRKKKKKKKKPDDFSNIEKDNSLKIQNLCQSGTWKQEFSFTSPWQ